MDKIIFECESITPMFMYGADKNTPELRPASIKGLMRFWWRAINGDLRLKDLKDREDEIFGNTEKKSSFSIKMKSYKFSSNKIPQNHKFIVEFIKSNRCDFDIQSFFELVVILGLWGQKGKGKQKTQGSIKIVKINNVEYQKKIDINYIYILLKKFSSNFKKERFKIVSKENKEKYPLIDNISISKDNILFVNVKDAKFKTIKKELKDYING